MPHRKRDHDPLRPGTYQRAHAYLMGFAKFLWEIKDACSRAAKRIISYDSFDQAVVGLILVNCIFLALDNPTAESPPQWQQVVDVSFTVAFTLEMSLKLMALGLQYFTDGWNWLDAAVVFEGIFSVFYDGGPSVKSLRVLRVLRPLRTVRRMPRVQDPIMTHYLLLYPDRWVPSVVTILQLVVTSLFRAGWTLGRIVCIFVVWLGIFAIMGVLLWSGTLDSRCIFQASTLPSNNGGELVNVDGVCGVAEDEGNQESTFCSSLELLESPYSCAEGQRCEYFGSSPYSGMINFDNLPWSLLTLFTVTTLEGWHEVMIFTQRVTSEYTIWFFVLLIVSATWAIMSLMIAAMLARFKAVSFADGLRLMEERAKVRIERAKLRSQESRAHWHLHDAAATLARSAEGVSDAIAKNGAEVGGAIVRGGVGILTAGPHLAADLISAHAESKPQGKTARLVGGWKTWWTYASVSRGHPRLVDAVLSEDSVFSQVIHWAIVLNVIIIAMADEADRGALADLGQFLTILFAAEASFKIYVLGATQYFKSRRNRFDLFVATTSVLVLILSYSMEDSKATASLRVLNILRVFRILCTRRLKRTVLTVVGVVIKSARDLWPAVALMLLMCFVFTVLGMQLFGASLDPGREDFADHDYALKTRFDTFFWSFVQVFSVIAGDNWTSIMYRTMENTRPLSAIFFVALIVLGESVLLNLVLAVVLEGASDQMKEKHAAQKFRDNTLALFHRQYMRLAMQRWNVKARAEVLLEKGELLCLPGTTAKSLGLYGFPRDTSDELAGLPSCVPSSSSPFGPRFAPLLSIQRRPSSSHAPFPSTPQLTPFPQPTSCERSFVVGSPRMVDLTPGSAPWGGGAIVSISNASLESCGHATKPSLRDVSGDAEALACAGRPSPIATELPQAPAQVKQWDMAWTGGWKRGVVEERARRTRRTLSPNYPSRQKLSGGRGSHVNTATDEGKQDSRLSPSNVLDDGKVEGIHNAITNSVQSRSNKDDGRGKGNGVGIVDEEGNYWVASLPDEVGDHWHRAQQGKSSGCTRGTATSPRDGERQRDDSDDYHTEYNDHTGREAGHPLPFPPSPPRTDLFREVEVRRTVHHNTQANHRSLSRGEKNDGGGNSQAGGVVDDERSSQSGGTPKEESHWRQSSNQGWERARKLNEGRRGRSASPREHSRKQKRSTNGNGDERTAIEDRRCNSPFLPHSRRRNYETKVAAGGVERKDSSRVSDDAVDIFNQDARPRAAESPKESEEHQWNRAWNDGWERASRPNSGSRRRLASHCDGKSERKSDVKIDACERGEHPISSPTFRSGMSRQEDDTAKDGGADGTNNIEGCHNVSCDLGPGTVNDDEVFPTGEPSVTTVDEWNRSWKEGWKHASGPNSGNRRPLTSPRGNCTTGKTSDEENSKKKEHPPAPSRSKAELERHPYDPTKDGCLGSVESLNNHGNRGKVSDRGARTLHSQETAQSSRPFETREDEWNRSWKQGWDRARRLNSDKRRCLISTREYDGEKSGSIKSDIGNKASHSPCDFPLAGAEQLGDVSGSSRRSKHLDSGKRGSDRMHRELRSQGKKVVAADEKLEEDTNGKGEQVTQEGGRLDAQRSHKAGAAASLDQWDQVWEEGWTRASNRAHSPRPGGAGVGNNRLQKCGNEGRDARAFTVSEVSVGRGGEGQDDALDGGDRQRFSCAERRKDDRAKALEDLPRELYGVFSSMMIKREKPRLWNKLDRVFGGRIDRAAWDRWHVRKSPVRLWCGGVVKAHYFETVMIAFVFASIALSMYPIDDLSSFVGILDTICLFAFVFELSVRVGFHSWWVGPDAVLRDPWALLDVYLVASHGVTTTATVLGLQGMQNAKRVLKSARPLRFVHRFKSLHEMSEALAHSLRSCGTLLVLIATLLFGYSMVGVEIFGGMFYSCSDPDFAPKSSRFGEFDPDAEVWISPPCSGDWVNPITGAAETRDFQWSNYVYHFDSLGPALLSALIVTTLDGWVEIFHQATNAYKVDHQPSENTNLAAFWYFFVGIIVFGFYITNLFVGVMFEAFLSYKNMDDKGRLISQAERRWRDYKKRLCQVSPIVAPRSCAGKPWRACIQRLVLSSWFNNFVVSVLVVNTVVLAVDHKDATDWQTVAQDIFNHAFAAVFIVEACLMYVGLGPRCYFSTGRQVFEFVVTAASLADVVLDVSNVCSGSDIIVLRLVRSLRVVRVIRLATHIPGFDQILASCTYPARILINVFVLLAIGLYMFANLGVALFASVELEPSSINIYQDFSTVWRAMQLLFVAATGEAWAEYASMVVKGGDQSQFVVMIFFVVFVIVMQFVLTNLFIMVIVETFETLNAMERRDLEDAIPQFQMLWSKFDPSGSGTLPPKHFFDLLLELKDPLGAAGNYATAGKFASMLKSEPDFDFSFTMVLVGLGAALLSDEKHVTHKADFRPVDIRKLMATLVVQRALKRNATRRRQRFQLSDIVLAASSKAHLGQWAEGPQLHTAQRVDDRQRSVNTVEGTDRRRSETQRDRVQLWTKREQHVARQEGSLGSISLPPNAIESSWLMRRFLLGLQSLNEEEGGMHVRNASMDVTGADPEERRRSISGDRQNETAARGAYSSGDDRDGATGSRGYMHEKKVGGNYGANGHYLNMGGGQRNRSSSRPWVRSGCTVGTTDDECFEADHLEGERRVFPSGEVHRQGDGALELWLGRNRALEEEDLNSCHEMVERHEGFWSTKVR